MNNNIEKIENLPYQDRFQSACWAGFNVFLERNRVYGDAFIDTGVLGASIELIGNISRLRELVLRKTGVEDPNHRSVLKDVFIDIHNFANFGLMMLEEDNWNGIEHNEILPDEGPGMQGRVTKKTKLLRG